MWLYNVLPRILLSSGAALGREGEERKRNVIDGGGDPAQRHAAAAPHSYSGIRRRAITGRWNPSSRLVLSSLLGISCSSLVLLFRTRPCSLIVFPCSSAERRISDLKNRFVGLQEQLETANACLEAAKQSREAAEHSLRGSEVELSMADASVHALEVSHSLPNGISKFVRRSFYFKFFFPLYYFCSAMLRKRPSYFAGENPSPTGRGIKNYV